MTAYEEYATQELRIWQHQMQRSPSFANTLAMRAQRKLNSYIPEKVHQAITGTIKQMVRAVLFGSELTTRKPHPFTSLQLTEALIQERIKFYKRAAAAEGGIIGAGGILLGFADFPLLLGLKLKMLFEIAALYGYSADDYRERLYLLHIFQLAFSSQEQRRQVYQLLENWEVQAQHLPQDIHQFDWRTFQQEYRDYIDLAKMAQLIPIIGAPIGAVVNYRLINKLGNTAMNAYRMRWVQGISSQRIR
ncbi:EcsC family protein [Pontibacter sp. JH31]|uniref:EcsC family protein n=1 Tax=Pontibacter aquaedesilientis TaxID=2766980 RepID=A0ABR7XI49_9BACT|nr:EcsC family protein [Pontibacter aquaedesilientis]MBD1397969.1 EcsC family protein [Pontibacter aquaedesilientis]